MVRVGLAGYGLAAQGFHAPLIRQAGLDVVAVATSDQARRANAERDLPGVALVADLDALLTVAGLDLVVLATPSGRHTEQALAVVAAGVPLVVDKPLSVDAQRALEVVDAAARAGVPLTVFQNRRFDPQHATLVEVIRSGTLGDVYRAELRWERWRPEPQNRWRETATAADGGGILLDLHSHLVDAAVQLFGEVEHVYAELAARTTQAEDEAFLACRHTGGAVSHLTTSWVSAAPGPRMRVLGSRAAFLLADFEGEPNPYADLADADPRHCGWVYRGSAREAVTRRACGQADFYRAVAAALDSDNPQGNMPVDPRDAVHTLAVIDAARTSAREHRVVDVLTPGTEVAWRRSAPRERDPRPG